MGEEGTDSGLQIKRERITPSLCIYARGNNTLFIPALEERKVMGNEWYFPSKPWRMNRQMVTCRFIQNHKLGHVTLPKVDAAVYSLPN